MQTALPQHASLPAGFNIVDNELQISGWPLSRLAQRVGSTPFYAYSRVAIEARLADLRTHLSGIQLHYALKANPLPALVAYLANSVDGADIASGGEMTTALNAGLSPQHIGFSGPAKSVDELQRAVAAGILIHIESMREIHLLAQISQHLALPARVALRINPDFELKNAGMKMGGGAKPFGIDAAQAPAALTAIAQAGLHFEGLHLFIGSQNLHAEAIIQAQQQSVALAEELAKHAPAPIKTLNLGGGFGIPYFTGQQPLDLAAIGENLAALRKRIATSLPQAQLVLELGRYIVGEAGIYVCRVIDRKCSHNEVFVIVDGGLHHHLAASGNFGQIIRKDYPVAIANRMGVTATHECVNITGPLCTPLDKLADKAHLPPTQLGDLVVIFQSGAYGASASPQAFLSHPSVPEVLI